MHQQQKQPLEAWLTHKPTFPFPSLFAVFDSMGKPGSGIMEASLSFLGFYSECIEAVAPVPKTGRPESTESKVGETLHATDGKGLLANLDGGEPVFGGRYCLANLQLSNSAIKALQVRVWCVFWCFWKPWRKGLDSKSGCCCYCCWFWLIDSFVSIVKEIQRERERDKMKILVQGTFWGATPS